MSTRQRVDDEVIVMAGTVKVVQFGIFESHTSDVGSFHRRYYSKRHSDVMSHPCTTISRIHKHDRS